MSRLMKIGKFVLPRSRLACCFLRGNGCGRGPTRKMSFRKHSFAFGGATIRSTSELAGVDEDGSARAGRRANSRLLSKRGDRPHADFRSMISLNIYRTKL